jgi:hypothetical protein
MKHATNHWHKSRQKGKLLFFFIWITFTVKKSNPATEPHGSPQGCTVRPRKGAGECSMGGGEFRVSRWAVLAALEVWKIKAKTTRFITGFVHLCPKRKKNCFWSSLHYWNWSAI